MTLKSRWIGLVTILVLFAMAPSSFAQVQIQIFPDVSSSEVQTNRNAQTARPGTNGAGLLISGSLLGASPLTATTLRIGYPGPITSQPAIDPGDGFNCTDGTTGGTVVCPSSGAGIGGAAGIPTGDPMRIEGATGVFAGVGHLRLNTVSSRIEVTLPNACGAPSGVCTATNTSSGVFRIVGVRIDANGKSGAQTFSASLNNSANNYLLSTTSGTVINNIGPGLAGAAAIGLAPGNTTIPGICGGTLPAGTATIFTNRNVPRACGAFILTEGFASAWRTAIQSGNSSTGPTPGPNAGTQIRLTFNNVPAGVTLALGSSRGSASSNSSLNMTLSNPTITSSSTTTVVTFVGTSTSDVEVAEFDYSVTTPLSTTAAVTTPGTISVTATLYPFGDGIDSAGVPRQDQGYPTVVEGDAGPTTIVNIVPANTVMLMPYALVIPPIFDTGIAIANTTKDPFGNSSGGATPGNGTITVDLFPTTSTGGAGTPFSLTTSTTVKPGGGLSSDGTLAAGATWTVLLSQLMTAAGQTGGFTGYIFIRANFLDAHGTATISDFKTYSLTANVLVLPPPATTPRDSVTVEALDF